MLRKTVAALAVALVATTVAPTSADAAKKAKRYRPQPPATSTSRSLDGRVLGRERTCGYDSVQYDGLGGAGGPECGRRVRKGGTAGVRAGGWSGTVVAA